MKYLNYNGQLLTEESAPPFISGSAFRNDSGLFETMLIINHSIQLRHYHFERMMKGIRLLNYHVPSYFNERFFEEEILKTTQQHPRSALLRARFQLFNENRNDFPASFIIECFEIDEPVLTFNKKGLRIGIIDTRVKIFDFAANLKTININLYKAVQEILKKNNWDDVLLVNKDDIVESGTSNIFWIKDSHIFTPPLSAGCIEGVMRRFLLGELSKKYKITEENLSLEKIFDADEVFLTNAVRRIKWVNQIDQKFYTNKITSSIYSQLFL